MRGRRLAPVLILAGVAVLWVGVEIAAPAAIRNLHAGRGPVALQRRLEGRERHSAEHYVTVWLGRARPAAAVLTVAALLAAALTIPAARRSFHEAVHRATGGDSVPQPEPPPRPRRIAVAGLAVLFAGGSLVELAIDPPYRGEHWPFSQYRMYSETPRRSPLVGLRPFGVTAEDPPREILLDGRYIRPFDGSRLAASWNRFVQEPDRERLLQAGLADCLRRYELRRAGGAFEGPPLQAVRLYRLTWDVDDRASTRDAPRRELICEVRASNAPTPSR